MPLAPVPAQADECARSVHRAVHRVRTALGVGLRESVYSKALEVELQRRGHHVIREADFRVTYLGVECGRGAADFLVDGMLVVEVKAVDALHAAHFAQTLTYIHGLRVPLGLLVNFHAVPLGSGIRRLVGNPPAAGVRGARGVPGEPGPDERNAKPPT